MEESHHKVHLVGWILDDPQICKDLFTHEILTLGQNLNSSDVSSLEQKFKAMNDIRFYIIRFLLNFNVVCSLSNLKYFMAHCRPEHWIWRRTRSKCHSGRQHTTEDLVNFHTDEVNWIMHFQGKFGRKYICDLENCETKNREFDFEMENLSGTSSHQNSNHGEYQVNPEILPHQSKKLKRVYDLDENQDSGFQDSEVLPSKPKKMKQNESEFDLISELMSSCEVESEFVELKQGDVDNFEYYRAVRVNFGSQTTQK